MRQILIEKYIKPSEIRPETEEKFGVESWLDRNEDYHSFMGHPAQVWYENGQIKCQEWYKKGVLHRDGDLPAEIFYDSNRQITYKGWYKKGKLHRDGDLPAEIWYNSSGEIKRQH